MNITENVKDSERALATTWAKGLGHVQQTPWLVYINTTGHYKSRCGICAHSKVMRPEKGFMSFDLFKKIVDQIPPGVQEVYLAKQGETFLHTQLERFIKYLKTQRPEIHICIHTNGTAAKRRRVEAIWPYIDSMGVSISAITPDIYKRVHNVNQFKLVFQNLRDISDLLLQTDPEKRPHVFGYYAIQSLNQADDESAVIEWFSENFPGLASVDLHWVYNFHGAIEEGQLGVYNVLPHDVFPQCIFPWSSIAFCHDGKVSYCFVEPREHRFLGDISQQGFGEIWNNPEYVQFREHMANRKHQELADDGFYCHQCSWLWSMDAQEAFEMDKRSHMPGEVHHCPGLKTGANGNGTSITPEAGVNPEKNIFHTINQETQLANFWSR